MPWSYKIDRERGLVLTTGWDRCTVAELSEHQRQIGSDPGFNSDFSQLLDFTRVTSVDVDFIAMLELSDRRLFSAKSRRAFFVGSNALANGMSRMFIHCRQPLGEEQMRVFTDRDQALQWLGVAPFD